MSQIQTAQAKAAAKPVPFRQQQAAEIAQQNAALSPVQPSAGGANGSTPYGGGEGEDVTDQLPFD
jgi:hypothetical protein